jgi:hypothetical protein
LNQLPLSQGNEANNFTNPCDQYGASNNVTEVRISIRPQRNGADHLVFTIYDTANSSVNAQYTQSVNCSATGVGGNCLVINNPLIVSFDSTGVFATYEMLARQYATSYAYATYYNPNANVPNNVKGHLAYVTDVVDCATLNNQPGANEIGVTTEKGDTTTVCPPSVKNNKAVNQFYDAPQNAFVGSNTPTTNDQCPVLLCQKENDASEYVAIVTRQIEPLCKIFDIQQLPSALMNIRVNVQNATTTQSIVLSTENGGTIQSIPGVLSARINTFDSGIGAVGPAVPGNIITCNTCPDGSAGNTNCVPGLVDDTAGLPDDGFSIINPFTSQAGPSGTPGLEGYTDCNLPTSVCRRNVGGQPSNANWFYTGLEQNYFWGLSCSQNGMNPSNLYNDPAIQGKVCQAAAFCPQDNSTLCGIFGAECVPGYQQQASSGLGLGEQIVFTPCQVMLIFAEFLAQYTGAGNGTHDFSSGYFFMPPGFIQSNPNYFIKESKLYTSSYAGDTPEVSVDMSIYLSGSLVAEVTTVAPGEFISAGQSCASTADANGALAYTVKNTGSVAGNYFVTATVILSTLSEPSLFSFTGTTLSGQTTAIQSIQVGPGLNVTGQFGYTYTGANGDMIQITLGLEVSTGSSGNKLLLEQETVSCTVIGGEVFINNIQSSTNSTVTSNPPPPKCKWDNLSCWDNVGLFGMIIRLIIIILIGLAYITALVLGIILTINLCRLCILENDVKRAARAK